MFDKDVNNQDTIWLSKNILPSSIGAIILFVYLFLIYKTRNDNFVYFYNTFYRTMDNFGML